MTKISTELANEFGLDLLVIFGSYSEDSEHKKSDLDLGFLTQKRLNEYELVRFYKKIFLDTEFEKIDLVDLYFDSPDDLKKHPCRPLSLIQKSIFTEGKVIFEYESGYFEELKKRAEKEYQFNPKTLNNEILNYKYAELLTAFDKFINWPNTIYPNDYKDLHPDQQFEIRTRQEDLKYYYALELNSQIFKLNRFYLKEFQNISGKSDYENMQKLLSEITNDELEINKILEAVLLSNLKRLDYLGGSHPLIISCFSSMKRYYPKILEFYSQKIHNG